MGIDLAGETLGVMSLAEHSGRRPRHLVKYASDMARCELCEEPWCEEHGLHFSECDCIGPHQDDVYDYEEEAGELYAVERAS